MPSISQPSKGLQINKVLRNVQANLSASTVKLHRNQLRSLVLQVMLNLHPYILVVGFSSSSPLFRNTLYRTGCDSSASIYFGSASDTDRSNPAGNDYRCLELPITFFNYSFLYCDFHHTAL